jgi:uncharacterized integral membrane protein
MAEGKRSPRQGASGQVSDQRSKREIARIVVAVVALVLLVAFVLGNSKTVPVSFVFFKHHISLIWVILISAFLGALVDRLVILLRQRRKNAERSA